MRHRPIRFAAALVWAVLVPATAFASVARVAGLHVAPDYLKGEDAAMFTYLSEVNATGHLAYVEAGSMGAALEDRAMGVVLPGLLGGSQSVWSFHLRQGMPALGQAAFDLPVGVDSFDPNDDQSGEAFDILYGRALGNGKLGLRVQRSFQSYDDGDDVTLGFGNEGRNVLGFGIGYEFETRGGTPIQLGALLQQRTFEFDAQNRSDGTLAVLLAGRAMRRFSGNAVLVPVVKYHKFDESFLFAGTPYSVSQDGWEAGLAGNWTVGTGDLFVLGAQVARTHYDYANDDERTDLYSPHVFAALETHLNSWLAFRAGARQAMFYSRSNRSGSAEQTWKEHRFSFHMGTSVKLGSLALDATLDPAFLQNPFAQLAGGTRASFGGNSFGGITRGAGDAGGVAFTQVSATYAW